MKFQAVVLAALVAAAAAAGATRAAQPGEAAALAWLAAGDRGAWAQSYNDAGSLFRSHTTAREWAIMGAAARGPFGPALSRKLVSEEAHRSLPGAPDGQYLILRFATRFAHKADAVETVALAREGAAWKVDGYFIK